MRNKSLLTALAVILLLPFGVQAEEVFNYTFFEMSYLNNGMDGTATAIEGRDRIDIRTGEGSGRGLRMSLALDSNLHVFAGYSGSNMDVSATQTVPYPTLDEMGAAFFTSPGAENWDGLCDLNGDGANNFLDLQMLSLADSDSRVASRAVFDGDMKDWSLGIGYNGMLTRKVGAYAQLFWQTRDLNLGNALFIGENQDLSTSENGVGATVGIRGQLGKRFELSGHVTYSPVSKMNLLAGLGAEILSDGVLFGIGGEFSFTDTFSICAGVDGDSHVRAWLLGMRYNFRS